MIGPGFGAAVAARLARALLLGGIVVLGIGAGAGFILSRLVR